ncbi:hypothetical protein V6Z12_D01G086900 [Gossypium hirsutum]
MEGLLQAGSSYFYYNIHGKVNGAREPRLAILVKGVRKGLGRCVD